MNFLFILIVIIVVIIIAYNIGKRSSPRPPVHDQNNYSIRMTTKMVKTDDELDEYDRDNWEGGFWEATDPKEIEAISKLSM